MIIHREKRKTLCLNKEIMIKMVDWLNIMPLLILAGSILLIMIMIAIWRNHVLTSILTLATLIIAIFTINYKPSGIHHINSLFTVDSFGVWFIGLLLLATFFITLISYSYLEKQQGSKEEFYLLLLTGTLGASVLAISSHFISFFLGLELLSVSIYGLTGYIKNSENSLEAAIKYLMIAGVSSAFLLLGIAFLYAQTGTLEFNTLSLRFVEAGGIQPLALTGFALMIVGIGFKLAVVPFHLWTPDVYEGAPAITSAFIASVSKAGVAALLVRLFLTLDGSYLSAIVLLFSTIAVLSILAGNLLALRQQNVKRILAYSSIAHIGYVLVAVIANGNFGVEAVSFYLLVYVVTTIGAFGIVSLVSNFETEPFNLEAYKGLFWRRPWLAMSFTTLLLSLAGIPLTAGFIGKFYVLSVGVGASLWVLTLAVVLGSIIGLYYYLKIIVEMFKQPLENYSKPDISLSTNIALTFITVVVIWLGVNPGGAAEMIRTVVAASF